MKEIWKGRSESWLERGNDFRKRQTEFVFAFIELGKLYTFWLETSSLKPRFRLGI